MQSIATTFLSTGDIQTFQANHLLPQRSNLDESPGKAGGLPTIKLFFLKRQKVDVIKLFYLRYTTLAAYSDENAM